jgi:hypothetical protein
MGRSKLSIESPQTVKRNVSIDSTPAYNDYQPAQTFKQELKSNSETLQKSLQDRQRYEMANLLREIKFRD